MTGNSEIIHSHIRALLRTSATHNWPCCAFSTPQVRSWRKIAITLCCNQALALKTRVNASAQRCMPLLPAETDRVSQALAPTEHELQHLPVLFPVRLRNALMPRYSSFVRSTDRQHRRCERPQRHLHRCSARLDGNRVGTSCVGIRVLVVGRSHSRRGFWKSWRCL
jgi:hypothetical protein